jgi:hypothetical protein
LKYRTEIEGKNGWTEWVYPLHGHGKHNHRVLCCDCGLVHELQFRIFKDTKRRLSVKFRARRNMRATAAVRRHKKRLII